MRNVDGVICGHIHAATIRDVSGFTYINCGDRVDSCTAIVEHVDDAMELIQWQQGPVTDEDPAEEQNPGQATTGFSNTLEKVTVTE